MLIIRNLNLISVQSWTYLHPRAKLLHKVLHTVMLSISNQNVVKGATVEKSGNYFEHAVFICFAAFLPLQPKPEGMQAYKSFIPTSIFIQTGPLELNIS